MLFIWRHGCTDAGPYTKISLSLYIYIYIPLYMSLSRYFCRYIYMPIGKADYDWFRFARHSMRMPYFSVPVCYWCRWRLYPWLTVFISLLYLSYLALIDRHVKLQFIYLFALFTCLVVAHDSNRPRNLTYIPLCASFNIQFNERPNTIPCLHCDFTAIRSLTRKADLTEIE